MGPWRALLDREPEALVWPAPLTGSTRKLNERRRELQLNCAGTALLGLGKTSAPAYQVEVCIQQHSRAGNVGLFLGYQKRPLRGRPAEHYEALYLRPAPPGKGEGAPGFQLRWDGVVRVHEENGVNEVSGSRCVSAPFRITPGENRLSVSVGRDGLEGVAWNGKELQADRAAGGLRRFCAARAAGPPQASAYRGAFGIYAKDSDGVFYNARSRHEEEK
jgi:hypothetical protein